MVSDYSVQDASEADDEIVHNRDSEMKQINDGHKIYTSDEHKPSDYNSKIDNESSSTEGTAIGEQSMGR